MSNPGPLCITLGTKVGFSRRLVHLSKAAAEGKGLSTLKLFLRATEEDSFRIEQHSVDENDSKIPDKISHTEHGGGDFDKVEDSDERLTHWRFADLTPKSQQPKTQSQIEDPLTEIYDIGKQETQKERVQITTGTFDASSNAQHVKDAIDSGLRSGFDAILAPLQEPNALEGEGFIHEDGETGPNPSSSTGSSTIQGDPHEAVTGSANRALKQFTPVKGVEPNSQHMALESDSVNVLEGHTLISTPSNDHMKDGVCGDADNIEAKGQRSTDNTDRKDGSPPESLNGQKANPRYDPEREKESEGTRNAVSSQEYKSRLVCDEKADPSLNPEDPNKIIDSPERGGDSNNVRIKIGIEDDHRSLNANGYFRDDIDDTWEQDQDTIDTLGEPECQWTGSNAFGNDEDFTLSGSTFETQSETRKRQETLAGHDEITYEDDGNDPEPLKLYSHGKYSDSNPSPLKRTRSDQEARDTIDNSLQGKVQYSNLTAINSWLSNRCKTSSICMNNSSPASGSLFIRGL